MFMPDYTNLINLLNSVPNRTDTVKMITRASRLVGNYSKRITRYFGSGETPPHQKFVRPKPGAGQGQDSGQKLEKLKSAMAMLTEKSIKETEAAEERFVDQFQKTVTKRDVAV